MFVILILLQYQLYLIHRLLLDIAALVSSESVLCSIHIGIADFFFFLVKGFPAPDSLMHTKSRKKLILTAAARFNAKPKTGVVFLEESKLIYSDLPPGMSRAESLASFLKGCTRLDKRLLGDFISKPENLDVLTAFIGLFDFKDVSMIIYSLSFWFEFSFENS